MDYSDKMLHYGLDVFLFKGNMIRAWACAPGPGLLFIFQYWGLTWEGFFVIRILKPFAGTLLESFQNFF